VFGGAIAAQQLKNNKQVVWLSCAVYSHWLDILQGRGELGHVADALGSLSPGKIRNPIGYLSIDAWVLSHKSQMD
jgi:hypothetical protein